MKRFAWAVVLVLGVSACGASTDPSGSGAGGAGGGAGAGGTGGSGGAPEPDAEYDLGWQEGDPAPAALDHHVTFVHETGNGAFLHVAGGFTGSEMTASAWSAPIGTDGSLGSWTRTSALPSPQAGHALAQIGDSVLAIGGMPAMGAAPTDVVRVGRLGDDGTIESWTEGTPLPAGRFHAAAVALGKDVWVLGGIQRKVATSTIFHAVAGDGGAPGAWREVAELPEPRSHQSALVRDGFLYVLGGISGNPNDASAVAHADVWRAPIGDGGALGEWEALEALPAPIAAHSVVAVGRSIFVMGGIVDNARPSAAVYRARFEDDGTLGAWEEIDALPQPRAHVHQSPVHGDRVYRVGGSVGGMQPRPDVAVGTLGRVDEGA